MINYCSDNVPYTRITEQKLFEPWEDHIPSVSYKEFSREASDRDTPYYPLRLDKNKQILAKYLKLAKDEEKVTSVGRLVAYRNLDMHVVVGEALDMVAKFLSYGSSSQMFPDIFS